MTHTAMTPETEMALRAMCDACTAVQTLAWEGTAYVAAAARKAAR